MPTNQDVAALWHEVRGLCLDPADHRYDVSVVSDALSRIIEQIGDINLPDRLAAALDSGQFTRDEGALLIGTAGYSTDDEGSRIQRVFDSWLATSADETRVWLALESGTVPFLSPSRRREVLTEVAARFPSFAEKCRYFIETYRD